MQLFKTTCITLLACASIFTACQKSSDNASNNSNVEAQLQTANTIAVADNVAENIYNDVLDNVISADPETGLGTGIGVNGRTITNTGTAKEDSAIIPHCFTITVSPMQPGVFPKTVTIDFGTGCTGPDGRTRRGKMITVFSGRFITPGSTATTSFDGYYSDSIKVEGIHILKNNSTAVSRILSVTVQNGKLTNPGGNYIQWNKTKTWTQVAGMNTPLYLKDDVFSITGTANGTVKTGDITNQWTTEIIVPLTRTFTCRWITKGQLKITKNDISAVLDYGNGDCDNLATLSINGHIKNILLF